MCFPTMLGLVQQLFGIAEKIVSLFLYFSHFVIHFALSYWSRLCMLFLLCSVIVHSFCCYSFNFSPVFLFSFSFTLWIFGIFQLRRKQPIAFLQKPRILTATQNCNKQHPRNCTLVHAYFEYVIWKSAGKGFV